MKTSWSRRLEAARQALFPLRVLLFAAVVPLVLRFRKLPSLPAWLEPSGEVPSPPTPEEVAALVHRVDSLIAAGRPVVRSGCVTRGLTLYRFLRLAGAEVSLRFGVGTMRGRFAAHCWIVYRGEPLAEPRDPRPLFTETWRIEPSPAGYNLHGVRLGVVAEGEGERAAAGIHSRLAGLPRDGGPPHDLTFEIHAGGRHGFSRPGTARPVYEPPVGEVVYDDGADLLYIGYGPRLRVLCEPAAGRVRASAAGLVEEDLWALSHPLFTLPLVEVLKRRGLYGLHAGGVCAGGRALLLPGTSGSGKSTLTLALARAGFGLLGDDTLFLARRPEGLSVLAFPDEFDLTDQTVSFFPELRPLLDIARPSGWRKRQVRVERSYGAEVVWECEPAFLVFPRVAGVPESALTPMERGEALLELAPNVLLTEPGSSQAHLDALADLVEWSDCYRLDVGTDLEGAVNVLEKLMTS